MATQLEELEAEVQRIREKRNRGINRDKLRVILNWAFLIIAAVGLVLYFTHDEGDRASAIWTIGIAMLFKILEFVLRFTA